MKHLTADPGHRTQVPLHDRVDEEFVAQYARDGFAVLRGALSAQEVDRINDEALRI